ncbi:MAG: DUF4381 domain-containing protein [Cellvibrionaceae bacterium]|nr:DUF4381 domain-containing protein [Cellvibrionaceae bacterium]
MAKLLATLYLAASAQAPQAADPLAKLRPLQAPAPVSELPALGWWLLGSLIIVAILAALWLWHSKREQRLANSRDKAQRAEALALLNSFDADNKAEFIADLNSLLKRLAHHHYRAQGPAQLQGQAWVTFLCDSCPGLEPQAFSLLVDGPYLPPEQLGNSLLEPLRQASAEWISKHRGHSDV